MPTILLAECRQEVSTFNPVLTHYDDFIIWRGDEILAHNRGSTWELAGALSVFDQRDDVSLVPTYSARSITSGGTLADADWQRIANEFLASIRSAPPVDGVYFSLHGAMASESEFDPEGYLLAETRKILGEQIPIVVSLDLHGILTDRMIEHSDAIVVYHTYPHVDFFSTGERSARLLLKILDGQARPVTARVAIPALVRGDELITETGLFGRSIRAAQAIEKGVGGLSAGMFIGNPFTDVPDLRSNSLVVLDGDVDRAQREAVQLATDFWAVREHLHANLVSLDEMVSITLETLGQGTVIITDAADATSSGASGDSNAVLRALLDVGYTGKLLLPIVDPAAAEAACGVGTGKWVRLLVGGALDSTRFEPVEIEARVRMLTDGVFVNESHGTIWNAGDTAVLEAGNIVIVVTSRAVSLYDRSLFLAHGQDPKRFDAVVVKSPHCQPQFFAEWGAGVVNVDAPGSTSANLPYLGHTRCARPMFPLEPDTTFDPSANVRVFQRD